MLQHCGFAVVWLPLASCLGAMEIAHFERRDLIKGVGFVWETVRK